MLLSLAVDFKCIHLPHLQWFITCCVNISKLSCNTTMTDRNNLQKLLPVRSRLELPLPKMLCTILWIEFHIQQTCQIFLYWKQKSLFIIPVTFESPSENSGWTAAETGHRHRFALPSFTHYTRVQPICHHRQHSFSIRINIFSKNFCIHVEN